jgi:undecaprenyl-diphosphatase
MSWSVVISLTVAAALGAAAFGVVRLSERTVRRLDAIPLLRSVAAGGRAGLSWITARLTAQLLILVAGSAMAFALAVLFVEILDAVVENDDLTALDRPLIQWISAHRPGWLTPFVVAVTDLGGKVLLTLAVGAAAVLVARRSRSWRPLLLAVCALGGCALVVAGIKVVIGRDRPARWHQALSESGFAFPSGHSASALVGWALVAWLVCRLTTNRTVQATAWVAAGMLTVAVGLSRTYLGVHYPSDVIGGWVLGAVWFTTVLVAAKLHPTGSDERAFPWTRGQRQRGHDALVRRFATALSISAIAALSATMGIVGTLAVTAGATTEARNPNVTSAQARQIALGAAGDGVTTEVELEWERGMLIWSVDVWKQAMGYDVEIDASTGTVISYGPDN